MKTGEIVIYQSQDGRANLDVRLENETVWLEQAQMAELFNRERSVISKHISNIFKEGELPEESNVQKMHIAHSDKPIKSYSLDVIISVGYRVKSLQGTQFRIWANKILKDYLVNEKIKIQQYSDLKQTVKLLSNVLQSKELSTNEAKISPTIAMNLKQIRYICNLFGR